MLYKYGKRARNFLGGLNLYFILTFYVLRAFLIKQLLQLSRLLDMR